MEKNLSHDYQVNYTFLYFSSKITYVVLTQSRNQKKGNLSVFH